MGRATAARCARSRWLSIAVAASLLCAGSARAQVIQVAEPVEAGTTAPDFALKDTTGATVRLSDFAGRAILLTFWSCHTDTCFTTVKVFEELLAKLGPLGLAAPTVCEEIPPALAADNYAGLLQRCSTGQKILLDPERTVRGAYRVRQLPTSVLIGPDLKIREVVRGVPPLRDPLFHARVEALVGSLPAPKAP